MVTKDIYTTLTEAQRLLERIQARLAANYRLYGSSKDPDALMVRQGLDDCRRRLEQSQIDLGDDVLRIAFVGSMSSGKSTLVNELLDLPEEYKLPAKASRTTANVTVLRRARSPEACKQVVIEYLTAEEYVRCVHRFLSELRVPGAPGEGAALGSLDFAALTKAVSEHPERNNKGMRDDFSYVLQFLASGDRARKEGARVWGERLTVPRSQGEALLVEHEGGADDHNRRLIKSLTLSVETEAIPAGLEIVDLPGAGAAGIRDTVIAQNYLSKIHGVVVLTTATALGMGADLSFAKQMYRSRDNLDDKTFVCVTKSDTMNDSEVRGLETTYTDLVGQLKSYLGIERPRVFFVAAYGAQKRRRQEESAPDVFRVLAAQEFKNPDLRDAIASMTAESGLFHFGSAFRRFVQEDGHRVKLREVATTLRRVHDHCRDQVVVSESDQQLEISIERLILQRHRDLEQRVAAIWRGVLEKELHWQREKAIPLAGLDELRTQFVTCMDGVANELTARSLDIASELLVENPAAKVEDVRRKFFFEFQGRVVPQLGDIVGKQLGLRYGWTPIWDHPNVGGFLQRVVDATSEPYPETANAIRASCSRMQNLFYGVIRLRAIAEEWRAEYAADGGRRQIYQRPADQCMQAPLAQEILDTHANLTTHLLNTLRVKAGGYFIALAREFRDEVTTLLRDEENARKVAASGALNEGKEESPIERMMARKAINDDVRGMLGKASDIVEKASGLLTSQAVAQRG